VAGLAAVGSELTLLATRAGLKVHSGNQTSISNTSLLYDYQTPTVNNTENEKMRESVNE